MAELSVVIPTIRRHRVLGRTLDRLERQDLESRRFEVVVAVDAAEPDLEAVRRAIGARTYEVRQVQGARAGASGTRNSGWAAARAPLILFLGDDMLPLRRTLRQHLDWHERYPAKEVGVLGKVRWARELRVTPFMRWLERGIQFDYGRIRGIEAGWGRFYTANASLKREILERVGGFDEEHLPFGQEDLEIAYRMSKHGFRLLYNEDAVAEHLHLMDERFWAQRVRRIARSERQLLRLHPELPAYFHPLFERAAAAPPSRGRALRLARFVPPWMPRLGPKVWAGVDRHYRRLYAPEFLAAWEDAEAAEEGAPQPDLTEFDFATSERSDSGPK